MLAFMFLPEISGNSRCSVLVPLKKHCPSAQCAYAANVMGKDLDIFALGAISLNYIYAPNCK
jgi:hypothetical protein